MFHHITFVGLRVGSKTSRAAPRKPLARCGALRRCAARGLFHQKFAKISKIHNFLTKNSKKSANFEYGAVQRYVDLVDLEKC